MNRQTLAVLVATSVGCSGSTPAPEPATQPAKVSDPATPPALNADEPWRAQPPNPGPAADLTLPVFERERLRNGLTVLVAPNKALPVVSFMIVSRGGSSTDPKGQDGLTSLGYELMGEGAGKRDAIAFSDAVADLGASFGTSADQDSGSASIGGLSRNADGMLALLADAVMRPRLATKDFDRVKKQTLGELVRRRGSAEGLAFEYVPPLLFGETHPYGHPASGTTPTVEKLDVSSVRRHLAKTLSPSKSALIAVGDIDLATATAMAKKHFGKWKGARARPIRHPTVAAAKRTRVTIVHKDSSPQTMVLIARPLFGRGAADEIPLTVTNQIYGGSFASRLNMNLREAKGYTYGAHSSLSLRQGIGSFLAYSKIRQDVTAEGLAVILSELTAMKAAPATDEELARAKDGLIRSLPGAFESNGSAAGAAASLFIYELPLDRYAKRPAEVSAVGGESVADMVDRYFDESLMHVLLVGDSVKILEAVTKLGLGEVVVRNP